MGLCSFYYGVASPSKHGLPREALKTSRPTRRLGVWALSLMVVYYDYQVLNQKSRIYLVNSGKRSRKRSNPDPHQFFYEFFYDPPGSLYGIQCCELNTDCPSKPRARSPTCGSCPHGHDRSLTLCVKLNDLTAKTAHPCPLVNLVTGRGP
jgi:hypothetical protein